MWIFTLHILLLLINLVNSNEYVSFAIDELYYQVSFMPNLANKLHLEAQLANGNVTPMALISELLGRQLDEKMFEEYSRMDISSGLKEQNDLLEFMEKAEKVKTSDDVRTLVGDKLTMLNGMKGRRWSGNTETFAYVAIWNMRSRSDDLRTEISEFSSLASKAESYIHDLLLNKEKVLKELSTVYYPIPKARSDRIEKLLRYIGWNFSNAKNMMTELYDIIKEDGRLRNELGGRDMERILQTALDEAKTKMSEFEEIQFLRHETNKVKGELKVLQEIRNSRTIEGLIDLIQKLEDGFGLGFHLSQSVFDKYKDVESASKVLEKVTEFVSNMDRIDWEVSVFKKRWGPLKKLLTDLQVPPGDFIKQLNAAESCFRNSVPYFSLQFQMEESDLEFYTQQLEDFVEMKQQIIVLSKWARDYGRKMDRVDKKLSEWREKASYDKESVDDLVIIVNRISEKYLKRGIKTFDSLLEPPPWEDNLIVRAMDKIGKVDFDKMTQLKERIVNKIIKIEKFLQCYSDANVDDIRKLLNNIQKVREFDQKPLGNAVEMVSLFKAIHKSIGELTKVEFETKSLLADFPLDSEDVKGITEGVGALEAIRRVIRFWSKMDEMNHSEIEKSDVKDFWNFLKSSLEEFSEELSHLKFRTKLSDFQKFISNVQFPNNIQIDPLINFYSTQYKGYRKNEILKYVEYVEQFQMDYPGYSSKLEKMNEAIGKMNKWLEDQKQGKVVDEEEEPYIDCAVSYCDRTITLPAAT